MKTNPKILNSYNNWFKKWGKVISARQFVNGRLSQYTRSLSSDFIVLFGIIFIAFILRLVLINDLKMVIYDGVYYIRYFFGDKSWPGPFPFGYPLLIQIAHAVISDEVIAARIVSVVLGSLLIIPLYKLLRGIASIQLAAILALVVALNPILIHYSTVCLSDIPYIFFWLLGFYYYYRGKIVHAVASESIAYFIRPEGLIYAVFFLLIYFIRSRHFRNFLYGSLVLAVALLAFTLHTHAKTDKWTLATKTGNIKVFYIDNWQKSEKLKGQEFSIDEVLVNLRDQYPKRVSLLNGYIAKISTLPIVIIGLLGLLRKPSIYWLLLIQYILTPLSGANMDVRYGLPYFFMLIIGTGLFFFYYPPLHKYKYSVVLLGALVVIINLKYLQDKSLLTPDESLIELKAIGLRLKESGYSNHKFMDRKPYTSFYAGAEQFTEYPIGTIRDVYNKAIEDSVDILVMHEKIIRIFRPNLTPLLYVPDSLVSPMFETIYNDITVRKDAGIRLYKVKQ